MLECKLFTALTALQRMIDMPAGNATILIDMPALTASATTMRPEAIPSLGKVACEKIGVAAECSGCLR